MTVVRELITVLGTQVDSSGFKQYETGIERLKASAMGLGKLFGIAFSVEKIIEFADGLVDAGKEVNKIAAQLKLIARPMDDVNETMQGVFELSQRLGVSYTHMLDTYKEFANEVRDTKIPTEDILKAVENIQKGFEVARATPEQQSQVMEALQRGFRSGKMRPVSVGLMKDILPPEAFNMLLRQFNLGVGEAGEEGLRQLAKEGKITAEAVVDAFKKSNATLDKQFADVPQKLGRVFTRIYNDLVKVTAQIYKIANASAFMGQIVWYMWTRFRDAVVNATESLGGLENVVNLVSIAFVMFLTRAIALTIAWGIASAATLVPWLLMAGAVTAVALAIQDLVYWVQGKKNLIGTFVGPFAELKESFKSLDIFAGFRAFKDLLSGDFEGFKKEFSILTKNMSAEVLLVATAVGTLFTAFFFLSKPIQAAIDLVISLGKVALKSFGFLRAGAAAGAATEGAAGAAGAGTLAGIVAPAILVAAATMVGVEIAKAIHNYLMSIGIAKNLDTPGPNGKPVATTPSGAVSILHPWWTPQWMMKEGDEREKTPDYIKSLAPGMGKLGEWLVGRDSAPNVTSVVPGALGPQTNSGPVDNSVNPVLNQTNNIKVETALDAAQIGSIIGDRVQAAGEAMLNGYTRDLQRAGPRTEKATQ